jgi:cytochrome c2
MSVKRILTLLLLLTACKRPEAAAPAAGDSSRGKQLIEQYGCNSCHIVPGIEGAKGMVGPSLEHVASRPIIATKIPNSQANMTAYIQNPQMTNPENVMPNLGVKPDEARDIAAYLYTLK